jgi:hypothetical protein
MATFDTYMEGRVRINLIITTSLRTDEQRKETDLLCGDCGPVGCDVL